MKKFFNILKNNLLPFIIGVITSLIGSYIYSIFQPERIIVAYDISQPVDIGKGLSTIFPSFELRHNGNIINNGVVQYIHGHFLNISKKDVKTTETNKQIELILPNSCQIMEVYVPQENNFEVDAIKRNNKIIFLLPETLKPDEKFEFYAIFNNHDEKEPIFDTYTRIQDVSLKDNNPSYKIHPLASILLGFILGIIISLFTSIRNIRKLKDMKLDDTRTEK